MDNGISLCQTSETPQGKSFRTHHILYYISYLYQYKILSFRTQGDSFAYLGLRGVPDRNAAELLRGKLVEGDREDAPELDEGTYYIVDIIGLETVTEEGESLGIITDVSSLATEVYTLEQNGKKILFPAIKGVVLRVDIENKKLVVDKRRFFEVCVD